MSRTMNRAQSVKVYKELVENRYLAEMAKEKQRENTEEVPHVHEVPTLRKSITPGTILILLAGRFKGLKVVYLKRLESGALLVTGPYSISGVPLQRIDQAHVIATSLEVNISNITIDESINDSMFKKDRDEYKKLLEEMTKNPEAERSPISEHRKELQSAVDEQIIPLIKDVEYLAGYMGERFRLRKGDVFHKMKF